MSAQPPRHVVVFVGPSLHGVDARAILDADYRPPARMGDVYALLATGVDTIALIDGAFHGEPSVWHRELLAAVDAGIRVIGASSMGALRAAELHVLGMEGHGVVFGWYRDGVVERDDEVALLHADADRGYVPLSEALVNIRATLADAMDAGVLDGTEAAALVDRAAGQHYPLRSLSGLLDAPACRGWSAARRDELAAWLRDRRRDIKREDAVSLLSIVAGEPERPEVAARAAPDPGSYRRAALSFRTIGGARGADLLARLDGRPPELARHRRDVVADWWLAAWARDSGTQCPESALHDEREAWRRRHDIGALPAWLHRQGMLPSELDEHLQRQALCAWLREVGPAGFGITDFIADQAKRNGLAPPEGDPVDVSDWILGREPSAFGYSCDVSVEMLVHLQATDQLSLLLEP